MISRRILATSLAALGCSWLLVACTDETPKAGPASTSAARDPDLPVQCSEWADAPDVDPMFDVNPYISNGVWQKVDGTIVIDASWDNKTDLIAVDVTIDFRITVDGQDITDQLPDEDENGDSWSHLRPLAIDLMLPQELANQEGHSYNAGDEVTLAVGPHPEWSDHDHDMELVADPVAAKWCVPDSEQFTD